MIYGIGTDIVRIERIGEALERHGKAFAERILGPEELEAYARRATHPKRGMRYLATRFAAKEAFAKALGTGIRGAMQLQALQTLNSEAGRPRLVASGALKRFMQERGLSAQVTISDEAEYAVAFVIVEQRAKPAGAGLGGTSEE